MTAHDTNSHCPYCGGEPCWCGKGQVTAQRMAEITERYRKLNEIAGTGWVPGLYAVRLPSGDGFRRALALCRRHGDYDRAEQAWYITVILPGQASAGALADLAGLGAVITRTSDQEEES